MVESWTGSMPARDRVEPIATTLSDPRTANWIADQVDVRWDMAKTHLGDLTESGVLLVTEKDTYTPDPTRPTSTTCGNSS
jgi:predicted ArsR family transcriptional regulator